MMTSPTQEICELLALGYLRHRRRMAQQMARRKPGAACENPLDDVAPRGRVALPENRTSEKEVA